MILVVVWTRCLATELLVSETDCVRKGKTFYQIPLLYALWVVQKTVYRKQSYQKLAAQQFMSWLNVAITSNLLRCLYFQYEDIQKQILNLYASGGCSVWMLHVLVWPLKGTVPLMFPWKQAVIMWWCFILSPHNTHTLGDKELLQRLNNKEWLKKLLVNESGASESGIDPSGPGLHAMFLHRIPLKWLRSQWAPPGALLLSCLLKNGQHHFDYLLVLQYSYLGSLLMQAVLVMCFVPGCLYMSVNIWWGLPSLHWDHEG